MNMTPPTWAALKRQLWVVGQTLVLFGPLLALMVYRAWRVDQERASYTDCAGCLIWPTLSSDLWIAGTLCLLMATAWLFASRLWRYLPGSFLLLVVLVYVTDLLVTHFLAHRLHLADVLSYGGAVGEQAVALRALLGTQDGAVLLLGIALTVGVLGWAALYGQAASSADAWRARSRAAAMLGLVFMGTAWAGKGVHYFDTSHYENVFALNAANTSQRLHSPRFLAELRAQPTSPPTCRPGDGQALSVLVVVVESWSLHHSRLFSGLDDLTPKLDALAQEGAWFPTYYSNGYSTETALIGLLAGKVPIATHKARGLLAYRHAEQDIHRTLAGRGYQTAFFTTGELSFGNKGEWLKTIGVQHREGADHPAYDGLPKGAFHAASDHALVRRFLSWYDKERGPQPFFATLLTVGTHPPFIDTDPRDPDRPGERSAFERADGDLDELVRELKARKFLDRGVLMVVGDHRVMKPVGAAEQRAFGEASLSRVPAFVLGATGLPPGAVAGAYQHTDLVPSILRRVADRVCTHSWQGLMWGERPTPAQTVIHNHPALRDQLRVIQGGRSFALKLDGDDTRWIGAAPENGEALLRQIVLERVSTDP